jgi:dihydroorotase/N-acyl-D-amino-acid deacylase
LFDGSGAPPRSGSVLVDGERIAATGEMPSSPNAEIIDCTGLAVAPGFIDAHSHSDLQLLDNRPEKVLQGVTTEVVGNCGFSPYPARACRRELHEFANGILGGHGNWGWASAKDYLDDLSRKSRSGAMSLVGHGTLRISVAGTRFGPLPESQVAAMERLLADAFTQGAAGFSTGLMYSPGASAPFEELVRLCTIVAKHGTVYATHMRDYSDRLEEAVEEQLELVRQTGCRLQISHLQAVGPRNWARQRRVLDRIEQAVASGLDVSFDCYPYTRGSTVMTQLLPQWALEGGIDGLLRRLADPRERRQIGSEAERDLAQGWDGILVSAVGSEKNGSLVGQSLAVIAGQRNVPPVETMLDLLVEERGDVNQLEINQSEENLREALCHPLSNVVSDGIYVKGRPHPRLYGTFPHFLGEICRDRGWLPLEQAIHKITRQPADRFRLSGRGRLEAGAYADITVFDASRIGSPATYEEPRKSPEGIRFIFRNGRLMKKVAMLACLVFVLGSTWLRAADPTVFPKPRSIQTLTKNLKLGEGVPILLPRQPTAHDLLLARLLTAELSDRYGVALLTKRVPALPASGSFILMGTAANPLVKQYLARHKQPPQESEGYALNVNQQAAVVAGTDEAGAFYGLQSLRQLIEHSSEGASIHGAEIRDWPFMPFRGIKLYLPGHEHIPYFKRFVRDVMALYKYNKLILEMDAAMRFDRHPELNAGWIEFAKNLKYTRRERSPGPGRQFQDSANADTADGEVLEKEEVAELVRYVRQFHIDVIPEVPSLTHSYYLLTRHRDLAEIQDAEWPDTYCPSQPKVYDLLFDVLDEYIEVMKPSMVHIGHDEWRMPLGVCRRCAGKDPTELYASDVNRIYAHLRSRGVSTAIYGDHLIEALRGRKTKHNDNPGGQPYDMPGALSAEQVKQLIPKDILIFNWFWDNRADEDLNPIGIGRKNEIDLSQWGFRQVFGNFSPTIVDFDRRVARKGIIGGVPSSWSATNALTLGKDLMFDILGCANLLWSTDRPAMKQLSLIVQQLLPGVRSRLGPEPLPSGDDTPVTVPIEASLDQPVRINQDVSSLIFTHACRKRGRNEPSFTATWNFADTAELLGWYEVTYQDGFVETIPIRYGVNILEEDWLERPVPKSLAYDAAIAPRAGGRAAFEFEWINPRTGIAIRAVRLRMASSQNPVKLSGLSIVRKRMAPEPKPIHLTR